MRLDFATLRSLYESGEASPCDVIASVYDKINGTSEPVWISVVPREIALARDAGWSIVTLGGRILRAEHP